MGKILLGLWLVIYSYVSVWEVSPEKTSKPSHQDDTLQLMISSASIASIKGFLHQHARGLSEAASNKVATAIECADKNQVAYNGILTIIDYSLPSSEKRLWVLDLKDKKLLFHTYVAHGLRSGTLASIFFSNKNNSRASSIGVFKTEKAYYGREGLSLRLDGLERSFNDNASGRSIVMHGGWYVEEDFIKKYGRAGRSWGCPALPLALYQPIIHTIKNNSLFVVYYPSEKWLARSKFLHCEPNIFTTQNANAFTNKDLEIAPEEKREPVLITSLRKAAGTEEGSAIVAMKADSYARAFHTSPPLGRMLRRQIEATEYIALSTDEFGSLVRQATANPLAKAVYDEIYLVAPYMVMVHGYYETKMRIVPLGKITEVQGPGMNAGYTVHFESNRTLSLYAMDQFIRWVGL